MRRLVVAGLLVISSATALPAEKPLLKPSEPQQNAEPDKRGTDEAPLAVNVLSVPPRTQEEREEQAKDRAQKADSDWWLVAYTGTLALATILLAIMTGMLWLATKRLVKGAEDTAKRQLRAYLAIVDGEVFMKESSIVATLEAKNSGQTSAYNMRIWENASIAESPPSVTDGEAFAEAAAIIGPNSPAPLQLGTIALTQEEKSCIEASTLHAYWVGVINYEDAFGTPHRLRFCLEAIRSHDGEWALVPTATGNYEERDG